MNVVPDCVCRTVLSRSSLRNCTCGAISEPNAAVAMRQPPPFDSDLISTGSGSGAGSGDGSLIYSYLYCCFIISSCVLVLDLTISLFASLLLLITNRDNYY